MTEIDKVLLKSLSERLKSITNNNNAYSAHVDQNITSENLQFNLSLIITQIILNLEFPDWSIDAFNQTISDYNLQYNTDLTSTDFEEINWIRFIDGEVLIPEIVRYFIWELGYEEENGGSLQIPVGKKDIVRCLQLYSQRCVVDKKPFIDKKKLLNILENNSSPVVTINLLCDREIIECDKKNEIYYWTEKHQYTRYLNKEIASTLWLMICGEKASEEDFRRYFKITRKVDLYFDSLHYYLNGANTTKISELALMFLLSEKDFLNSENEFRKMWLDAYRYSNIDINTEIPKITIDYNNTFSFIQNISQYKHRFNGVFDGGEIRNFSYSLLRIIITNAPLYPDPYQAIIGILKDTDRPSLILTAYYLIQKQYPQVIPYLLMDNDLIPVAFNLLYEITFDDNLLLGETNRDKKEEKKCESRNQIWLEIFDFVLDSLPLHSYRETEKAEAIAKVLLELSQKVFNYNYPGNSITIINHNASRRLYDVALKKLSEHRIRNIYYSYQTFSLRTIFKTFPYIIDYLVAELGKEYPTHIDHLKIKSGLIDLSIEIIRNSNIRYVDNELTSEQQISLSNSINELTKSLHDYLFRYYSQENMEITSYDSAETKEIKMAKRGINEFGYEIIDWGYLYLHFEKNALFDILYDSFTQTLNFDITSDKYESRNKEQGEKIRLYLKALMLGFISINQNKDSYEIDGLPVRQTIEKITLWIKNLSLQYSVEDIQNKRIDAFDESFNFGNNMYSQSLTNLLYESINYFTNQESDPFIDHFFNQKIDLGIMLRAVNALNSDRYKNVVSQRISSLKVEDFIDKSILTTSIQNALVDAINSESHWRLALPLINSIDSHYKRIKYRYEDIDNLIFEVSLLYAFKEKDYDKLLATQLPERQYKQTRSNKANNLQQFYIALFQIYNNEDYSKGILILKKLLSEDPKDIQYAYHIYRAKTLQALDLQDSINLLIAANQDWDKFVNELRENEKKGIFKYEQAITSNKLHYFIAINEGDKFDRALSTLSNQFLYDEDIVPIIYNYYLNRSLHFLAYNYIRNAFKYLQTHNKLISDEIQSLIDNSENKYSLEEIKKAISHVPTLKAKSIPYIVPEGINGKRNLSEFILHEFVDASKVMIEKIHGIKDVSREDRYNDLFVAILKLRFQLWGWGIHDQARRGSSPSGKSAGETDLTIEAGNKTIALFEALILKGKNKSTTQAHVLKTFDYAKNLERYYMIVYFMGKSDQFENTWNSYKNDIETCNYKTNYMFDTAKSFEDLSALFDDINHLKVARTIHGHHIEMYHMMIDLSE